MKKILIIMYLVILSIEIVSGQSNSQYLKSTSSHSDIKDDSDLSKLKWNIQLKDKEIEINSLGRTIYNNKSIVFTTDATKDNYISGIEYVLLDKYAIILVGYENFDTSFAVYYKLDLSLNYQPEYIAYSSGMGANQFLTNGKNIFEATQFCFRLYSMDLKKDIWINKEAIGNDYHYKNIVTYLGDDTVRVEYMHTVESAEKYESIKINIKDGKIIKK